jgi:hypothetical protein
MQKKYWRSTFWDEMVVCISEAYESARHERFEYKMVEMRQELSRERRQLIRRLMVFVDDWLQR